MTPALILTRPALQAEAFAAEITARWVGPLRTILSPLGNDWNDLEHYQRKTWLGIAERWPTLSHDERVRAWDRMRAWAKLPPEARQEARERYRRLQELPPAEPDIKPWAP